MGARPGWSRRAQYGLFFSFVAALTGVLLGIVLLAMSLAAPNAYAGIRGAALDTTAPVTGALREAVVTVEGLFSGAGNYWNAARQNAALKQERATMQRQILQAGAIINENRQLKAVLQLREKSARAVATGRIVGSSFESQRRFAVISAGTGDGVRIGMPVRAADGLIGRVVDAGRTASRVLLISDRSNVLPTRLLRGGMAVISTGRGDGTVDLRPLEVGRNPFRRGDVVVTSGTGGLYSPLIPVARVVRLDDDGAIAVPLADPSDTSFAVVETPFEEAALAVADETADAP
ncbi:rod shape-determining protein MreC [Sphingomonas sp. GCM10030256]|uniref:rod shape-determining protein MreC n=1 Tax=Sphingomonas sp. GCM10030256 TaxID=3273427 RepID=UPI00361B634A